MKKIALAVVVLSMAAFGQLHVSGRAPRGRDLYVTSFATNS